MPERAAWAKLPNFLSLLVLALIAINYFAPFADLDFGWQVRTGELILESRTLRAPESFSYTIPGEPVPDFEWLYEVTLAILYNTFGFGALKFLRVVLVAAPFVLVAWRLRAAGVRPHGIALALLTAVVVLAPAWNLRPLYVTTIGLLLVSGWLHDHCTGRKPLPWYLPVATLIWANCHPGVITGQGLLAGAIGWEWLNRFLKVNAPLDLPALRRLTVIGGLGLAATFLSPDPVDRLLYPFRPELAHPIQRVFAEMQPLYTFALKPPYLAVIVYAVALLVLLTVFLRFREYRLWELALLGGLTLLANVAYRSMMDWLMVMLALGVPHLVQLLAGAARQRRRAWAVLLLRLDRSAKKVLHSPLFRWQPAWPLTGVTALLIVSLIPPLSRRMPIQDAPEWPAAAVAFLQEKGITGNFFGPSDYGAYLVWKMPGQARSYTDTRGFFFPPSLLEDSHYVPQLYGDWRKRLDRVLDEYPTDYFLLETTGPRGELWRRLKEHVGTPVFVDQQCVVLTAAQVRVGLKEPI